MFWLKGVDNFGIVRYAAMTYQGWCPVMDEEERFEFKDEKEANRILRGLKSGEEATMKPYFNTFWDNFEVI